MTNPLLLLAKTEILSGPEDSLKGQPKKDNTYIISNVAYLKVLSWNICDISFK